MKRPVTASLIQEHGEALQDLDIAETRAKELASEVQDLNGTVFELAGFFPSNEGVLDDARARAIVMDVRAWLRRVDHLAPDVRLWRAASRRVSRDRGSRRRIPVVGARRTPWLVASAWFGGTIRSSRPWKKITGHDSWST